MSNINDRAFVPCSKSYKRSTKGPAQASIAALMIFTPASPFRNRHATDSLKSGITKPLTCHYPPIYCPVIPLDETQPSNDIRTEPLRKSNIQYLPGVGFWYRVPEMDGSQRSQGSSATGSREHSEDPKTHRVVALILAAARKMAQQHLDVQDASCRCVVGLTLLKMAGQSRSYKRRSGSSTLATDRELHKG